MRRDNFLSCAFGANKDGTLYKSPAKSHFVLKDRENALSGVASNRKKQRPSLEPFAAVWGKSYRFFGFAGGFPG
jgi:hypothetical protein